MPRPLKNMPIQPAHRTPDTDHAASLSFLTRTLVLGFIAIFVLGSVGCRPAAERKLTGRWQLDESEGLAKRMLGNNPSSVGEELLDSAIGQVMDVAQLSLVVEFGRSGKLSTTTNVMGEATQKTGTWSVTEHSDEKVTVEFVLEGDEPQTIEVRLVDDDTIEMVPPNLAVLNRKYTFKRMK